MNIPNQKIFKRCKPDVTTSCVIENTWKIDQFRDKLARNNTIDSPKFSVENHDIEVQFMLDTNSNNDTNNSNEKFMPLFLYFYFGKTIISNLQVSIDLCFIDIENNIKNRSIGSFDNAYNNAVFPKFASHFYIMNPANKIFHINDQLHIHFKATVYYIKGSEFILNQLELLENGMHSDVGICVDGTVLKVHKTNLSSRSPVFKRMFSYNDTEEAQRGQVIITDFSINVMKIFLEYVYTGVFPRDDRVSIELLAAAEKYQVNDLKLYCEEYFLSNLNVNNVTDVLQYSELHNAPKLEGSCLIFMATNYYFITKTDGWKRLLLTQAREKILEITKKIAHIQASTSNSF